MFLNNDKLRKMGMSDKDIAALPEKVEAGEFTAYDLCDLAGKAVQKGVVKYGILHRPNTGPDFQMLMEGFGAVPYDKATAKLQASKAALKDFFTWVKYCVDKKAMSATNTSMSWDAIERRRSTNEEALIFFHGVWRVTDQMKACNLKGKDDYFRRRSPGSIRRRARRAASRPTCRIRSRMRCRPSRRTRSSPRTSSRWPASRCPTRGMR